MRETCGRWVEDRRMKVEEGGRTKGTEAGREDRTKPEVRRTLPWCCFTKRIACLMILFSCGKFKTQ